MKTYIISFFIIIVMTVSGCNSGQTKHIENEEHNNPEKSLSDENHSDKIVFTKEQAAAVGLEIETIDAGNFNQVIKTSGQIQTLQGDEATIAATSAGIVSFVNRSITDGASVKSGEAIVSISAKNLQDGDPATKAAISYNAALKEYERAESLINEKIISAKEFEQVRLRYETAKTAYQAQSANVTASGVMVVSPISGYVKNLLVNQGEYVSLGQSIATISQNNRLQLRAEVPESYFKSLKNINSANFKPAYGDRVYKLADLNGRLLSFGKSTDRQSPYIPITFEFDNTDDIPAGSYAEVYLLSVPQNNVISVPVSALVEEQGLYFVYLQLGDEIYKKQEVTLGQENGESLQIIAGLTVGDKIVTKSAYHIKLAANSFI
ncbi:MAG: efflux RND transporter periplasmic adaptor subunit, partial [Paludibacter sp.]|nr:efflux RND transporter periplasmic adaptor subunit [Paludibacter sp.]